MKPVVLLGILIALQGPCWSQATSCLVLGEKTAKIMTPDGEKSPVFVAKDCSALKLLTGKAQASWVARDGKLHLVPITAQGVTSVPIAGSEERSVNVVWSELTSRRERQQPAYMRSFGGDRAPKVFIPAEGLTIVEKTDSRATLRLFKSIESGVELLKTQEVLVGNLVRVSRSDFSPEQVYVIQIQRGDLMEEWKWRALTSAETASLDAQITEIEKSVEVPDQRLLLEAMLFEQLKMRVNMDFLVQQYRTMNEQNN
jgi:hypothetical protein